MKLDLDAHRDLVYADPSQIQQIIMNLCTNASHAMREKGGTLEVSLRATAIDRGEPLREPDMEPGEYMVLSVSDTGQGMDDSVIKRIFEPFFTTGEKGHGTGLGLSVVYGIVKEPPVAYTCRADPERALPSASICQRHAVWQRSRVNPFPGTSYPRGRRGYSLLTMRSLSWNGDRLHSNVSVIP